MLETIISLLQGLILIKIAFLILSAFFIAFLLIVFNQVRSMQRVVDDASASSLINTVALFNVIVGISLFVAALVIL